STPYQRIVITGGKDLKLYLNGNLQFNTRDEYRYHEALIHPALGSLENPQDILVLGGGDGLAVRELLKYPSIKSITLVDLDKHLTGLFKDKDHFGRMNGGSLLDPKVKIINADAFVWLRTCKNKFDFVCIDFPDPSNFSLGKLYSDTFYRAVKNVVRPAGLVVVQSTSPFYAKNSFWCVVKTLEATGFFATPYHTYVPSFGDWGYVIASMEPFKAKHDYPQNLRFVSKETTDQMFNFPKDMQPTERHVNKLNNQALVHMFEEEWGEYVDSL
ncbi:MAG: polyamine aminopropyltransferase, partial [Cyanobacteria bacterium]|nr:polyamine aminopropyltransferase [Cyanobacteriota bacterium]